ISSFQVSLTVPQFHNNPDKFWPFPHPSQRSLLPILMAFVQDHYSDHHRSNKGIIRPYSEGLFLSIFERLRVKVKILSLKRYYPESSFLYWLLMDMVFLRPRHHPNMV